jgi:hypothetical protein
MGIAKKLVIDRRVARLAGFAADVIRAVAKGGQE